MIIILKICTSTHLPLVPHVCISIVSGNGLPPFRHQAISSAGCRKKISVLQAPLWDHLVLQTILAFLFSRMHTDHDSQPFFCEEMTSISSKKFDPEQEYGIIWMSEIFFFFFFFTFRSLSGARDARDFQTPCSPVPEPCWLIVNWTLRNKSKEIYFTLLSYSFVYHGA